MSIYEQTRALQSATHEWEPILGNALEGVVTRSGLPEEARTYLIRSTLKILGRSISPYWGQSEDRTTLVVGRVQSGKTLSFTSLIAGAYDNGFPLVIVLGGTKTNLKVQTYERLLENLIDRETLSVAEFAITGSLKANDAASTVNKIRSFQSENQWVDKQCSVVVTLKHPSQINRITSVIEQIMSEFDEEPPVLIIDDESDQAGLNTLHQKGLESSTYLAIKELRSKLPNHSYVMYTATPEANLLVAATDILDPMSVTVLEEGDGYVGGELLFGEANDYVQIIPFEEVGIATNPERTDPIPNSLMESINYFIVAVAYTRFTNIVPFVSMLIHPSVTTDVHGNYEDWVRTYLGSIAGIINDHDDESYRFTEMSRLFAGPYEIIRKKHSDPRSLPPLVDFFQVIEAVMANIHTRVVNSGGTNGIGQDVSSEEWGQHRGWILIGGSMLDRGFTIENLAVTYMARGKGVGNADNLQQRGRFYGYKQKYLNLLRGWFPKDTADIFADYTRHEAMMRGQLAELDLSGTSLKDWRRKFLLGPGMHPTRSNVIARNMNSNHFKDNWSFIQSDIFGHQSLRNDGFNDRLTALLSGSTDHPDDNRSARSRVNRMRYCIWGDVAEILVDWDLSASERMRLDDVVYALGDHLESLRVLVIEMDSCVSSQGQSIKLRSRRGVGISNLHQGKNASGYPGDAKFFDEECLTIQVHRVGEKNVTSNPLSAWALAVALPKALRTTVAGELR